MLAIAALTMQPGNLVDSIRHLDESMPASTIIALKAILAAPLTFHYLNGIRHIIWDLGYCLSLPGIYYTGYITVLTTLIVGSLIALVPNPIEL